MTDDDYTAERVREVERAFKTAQNAALDLIGDLVLDLCVAEAEIVQLNGAVQDAQDGRYEP